MPSAARAQQRWDEGRCPRCGVRGRPVNGRSCLTCASNKIARDRKVREEVIQAYGGKCTCCGETTSEFMTIDHIDNNGAAHRRELLGRNVGGNSFYHKLKLLGFPAGLQVLCWNCNAAKQFHGGCPHQRIQHETRLG